MVNVVCDDYVKSICCLRHDLQYDFDGIFNRSTDTEALTRYPCALLEKKSPVYAVRCQYRNLLNSCHSMSICFVFFGLYTVDLETL